MNRLHNIFLLNTLTQQNGLVQKDNNRSRGGDLVTVALKPICRAAVCAGEVPTRSRSVLCHLHSHLLKAKDPIAQFKASGANSPIFYSYWPFASSPLVFIALSLSLSVQTSLYISHPPPSSAILLSIFFSCCEAVIFRWWQSQWGEWREESFGYSLFSFNFFKTWYFIKYLLFMDNTVASGH